MLSQLLHLVLTKYVMLFMPYAQQHLAHAFSKLRQSTAIQMAAALGASGNSCGYGALNTFQWPFLAGVTMSAQAPLLKGALMGGCGGCFEIQCDSLVSLSVFEHSLGSHLVQWLRHAIFLQSACPSGSQFVVLTGICAGCTQDQLGLSGAVLSTLAPARPNASLPVQYRQASPLMHAWYWRHQSSSVELRSCLTPVPCS